MEIIRILTLHVILTSTSHPERRLGATDRDSEDVKKQQFFRVCSNNFTTIVTFGGMA